MSLIDSSVLSRVDTLTRQPPVAPPDVQETLGGAANRPDASGPVELPYSPFTPTADFDLPIPKLPGHATTTYDASDLYGPNGPQDEDIQQKNLGDCYFVATLASVAETDPTQIMNAIDYDASSGNFTVTLHEKDASGNVVEREVVVTQADIQDNIDRGGGSTAGSGGPLWPAVMEAAFAKMHLQDASANGATPDPRIDGGYGPGSADKLDSKGVPVPQLDANGQPMVDGNGNPVYQQVSVGGINGGFGTDAYLAITGNGSTTLQAPVPGQKGVFGLSMTELTGLVLQGAINSGQSVTVATAPEASGEANDGLVDSHQYTVERVYKDGDGVWQVELRNPWGNNGSDGHGHGAEGLGDGGAVITVPLDSIHTHGYQGFVIGSD